jgi:hypothetical protein
MSLVWEVYSKALQNDDPTFRNILAYSARACMKTLAAALIETLFLLHLKIDVVHGAAIKEQSDKCKEYIKDYFNFPILNEVAGEDNDKNFGVRRYESLDGTEAITPKEWLELTPQQQHKYKLRINKLKIVVATVKSMNGQHAPLLIMDELDVIDNPRVIKEARFIPDTDKEGHYPMAFYTSTRKSGIGPVQAMIDDALADESKEINPTKIRHWNIIDVTQACPKSVNKMNLGKINLYINKDLFKTITEDEWKAMPEVEQAKWEVRDGYKGCIKCPIFAGCQGNLATKQKSNSPALKKLGVTLETFASADLDDIQAQLMCWKPSSQGLIFPHFDPLKHVITAAAMAKMITGDDHPDTFTKFDLIKLFQKEKAVFYSGMDHGFTHPFSVVSGVLVGHRLYIFDVIVLKEVELSDKIKHCKNHLLWNPAIFADTSAAESNNAFIKDGFHMMNWTKGEVTIGIECVRKKLRPATDATPELFFLAGDDGVEYLTKEIQKYHWKTDAAGRALDEPVKIHDDTVDALRYLCQNLFLNNGMLKVKSRGTKEDTTYKDFYDPAKIIAREISNRAVDISPDDHNKKIGRKGFKVFLKRAKEK